MIECKVCLKQFSLKGIGTHIWRSHGEGRDFKPGKSHPAWNKGLKADDPRVAKSRISLKKRFESGDLIPWQLGKSKLTDERIAKQAEKIAKTVKQKISNGDWHVSFSKRRIHERNGVKFHGTWELRYSIWLDEQGINWIRNEKSFPYYFNEVQRQYTPDFFLPEQNLYIEIKGYETEKDRAKWLSFPYPLIVIKGNDLKLLGVIENYKNISL